MPITNEEISQKPMSVQLVPMEDQADPHRFAVLFRFPCGTNQVWTFLAPSTPIDDDYLRNATLALVEGIVSDLRDGRSEPQVKRNAQAFREFESCSASVVGALNKLLVDWARKRVKWAEALAAPTIIQ